MIFSARIRAMSILVLMASLCITLGAPARGGAQLHDPMRPSRTQALNSSTPEDDAAAVLPPLHAILISTSSKTAIFGKQRVHEGERIGRYRIKSIRPGRVELTDGDSRVERRLFPAINAIEDDR